MRKLISSINITADGFCGHSDVVADEEHHQFAIDLMKKVDTVLFGRITYQLFESYWPLAAKDLSLSKPMFEFAQLIDNVNKVVASKSLTNVHWKKTTVLKDINEDSINGLKRKAKTDILIFGSPGLISVLTNLGLIDEYYFSVQPLIVGNGKRLFEMVGLDKRKNLRLSDTKYFKSGVVTLCYQNIKQDA